jgi:hypothetical protein
MSTAKITVDMILALTKAIEVAQSGARCGVIVDERAKRYEELELSLVSMLKRFVDPI